MGILIGIGFVVAVVLIIRSEMVRRKESRARHEYISKIEREWFENLNKK